MIYATTHNPTLINCINIFEKISGNEAIDGMSFGTYTLIHILKMYISCNNGGRKQQAG